MWQIVKKLTSAEKFVYFRIINWPLTLLHRPEAAGFNLYNIMGEEDGKFDTSAGGGGKI